jgi:cell division protein FtsB
MQQSPVWLSLFPPIAAISSVIWGAALMQGAVTQSQRDIALLQAKLEIMADRQVSMIDRISTLEAEIRAHKPKELR